MKQWSKENIITSSPVVIVFVLFAIATSIIIKNRIKVYYQVKDCPIINLGRYGKDFDFFDCHNTIAIDKWLYDQVTIYSLWDIQHKYYVVGFRSFDQYRLMNDIMYVVNHSKDSDSYIAFGGIKYYDEEYFINGEMKTFYHTSIETMPNYFAIDTVTGNVRPYKMLSEVPVAEQSIFQEIETRVAKNDA